MKILVDGYNIGMPQGTGIKGYGLTLLDALEGLGHETSCLFDRPVGPNLSPEKRLEAFSQPHIPIDHGLDKLPWPMGGIIARYRRARHRLAWMMAGDNKAIAVDLSQATEPVFSEGPHGMVYTVPSLWDRAHHNDRTGQSPIEVETDTKFDAFHLTTPVHMRVKNTPMVLTVHDTIPFSLPGSTTENLDKLRVRFQSALDAASLVATVSEHTRSDVLSLFDVDPDKVMNTYQPVLMQPLSPEEQAGLGARLAKAGPGLSAQGYLLFVGAIEPKKNLGRLVEAYRKVDPDLPLVVVGRLGWMYDDVVAAMKAAGTKVIHLPYVDRSVLRDVIAGARAMFFPSLYEGFGLPVIEAMVLGTPVVTSNTTSLGEVAGEAALTVDPLSVDAIAEALDAIVTSEAECARLSEAGQTRAQEFSMGRYQERLKALYDRL